MKERAFIQVLEQNSFADDLSTRMHYTLTKLAQHNSRLKFKLGEDLHAVKTSESDTDKLELAHSLGLTQLEVIVLKKHCTLYFDLSKLPYRQCYNSIEIQHVIDENRQIYRLCCDGLFMDIVTVRHYSLSLLDPSLKVVQPEIKEANPSRSNRRLKLVDEWMKDQIELLNLPTEATPQDVHNALTKIGRQEKTQMWYWGEWYQLAPDLFPANTDPRNFFNKVYRKIQFSRGNR